MADIGMGLSLWSASMEILDYERLVADFELKLLTQLRNFGADAEYLEMWVPDEDPVKSLLNMVEAAEAFGQKKIVVQIGSETMPVARLDELVAQIGSLGRVAIRPAGEKTLVTVTEIGT